MGIEPFAVAVRRLQLLALESPDPELREEVGGLVARPGRPAESWPRLVDYLPGSHPGDAVPDSAARDTTPIPLHPPTPAEPVGDGAAAAVESLATADELIERLARTRRSHHLAPGARARCERAASEVLAFLFPHFASPTAGAPRCEAAAVRDEISSLRATLRCALAGLPRDAEDEAVLVGDGLEEVVARFLARLPALYEALVLDARALLAGDPAARTIDEVLLAYPGFRAVALYRVAHELHLLGVPLAPRLVTELAHRETGIDIHPGAHIGSGFAIDHGTGVVIGETAVIGDRVKIYQGVTLGAASVRKELANRKRHPTVGDDVVIYAHATILGGDTTIGERSVIGGNVWLTHSVPPESIVVHDGVATRVRGRGAADVELEYYL
jgi:serine O-acetyltransferase